MVFAFVYSLHAREHVLWRGEKVKGAMPLLEHMQVLISFTYAIEPVGG